MSLKLEITFKTLILQKVGHPIRVINPHFVERNFRSQEPLWFHLFCFSHFANKCGRSENEYFEYLWLAIVVHSYISNKFSIGRFDASLLLSLSDGSFKDGLSIFLYFSTKSIILPFTKSFLFHGQQNPILLMNQQ